MDQLLSIIELELHIILETKQLRGKNQMQIVVLTVQHTGIGKLGNDLQQPLAGGLRTALVADGFNVVTSRLSPRGDAIGGVGTGFESALHRLNTLLPRNSWNCEQHQHRG